MRLQYPKTDSESRRALKGVETEDREFLSNKPIDSDGHRIERTLRLERDWQSDCL